MQREVCHRPKLHAGSASSQMVSLFSRLFVKFCTLYVLINSIFSKWKKKCKFYIFFLTLGRKYPIPARRKNGNVSFSSSLRGIVYYAPREKKSRRLGCQFTRAVDCPILLPWSVYYFSSHRGRKCHISVSEPGGNEALSARCEEKIVYAPRE